MKNIFKGFKNTEQTKETIFAGKVDSDLDYYIHLTLIWTIIFHLKDPMLESDRDLQCGQD